MLRLLSFFFPSDLRKSWETWPLNNGQISTDVVLSLLKNNSTEIANTLETFDTNADGYFTEDEFQNALGLHDAPPPRRCKFFQSLLKKISLKKILYHIFISSCTIFHFKALHRSWKYLIFFSLQITPEILSFLRSCFIIESFDMF